MTTLTVQVSDDQLLELASRLPSETKRKLLRVLIPEMDRVEALVDYGEARARDASAGRGIDWDGLTPAQREALVDQILHEP
ncbi:MAG: hypothetical protein ACYDA8_16890 [Deferrisomatales bacterium]